MRRARPPKGFILTGRDLKMQAAAHTGKFSQRRKCCKVHGRAVSCTRHSLDLF